MVPRPERTGILSAGKVAIQLGSAVPPAESGRYLGAVRIAVLADIHGNLPALRAVLAELDREPVDAIVVGGDVVGGPLVRETLELLAARPEPVHWVAGNSERETVAVYDGAPASDDPAGRAAGWSARAIDDRWRAELGSWPISLALDGVCFCHGSPRRDDEILTRVTPEDALAEALAETPERFVVGGHTHQQMVREQRDGPSYANAGSVGLPYEGRPGAFWMIVADGVPAARETSYDVDSAMVELRASGFPDIDEHLEESLVRPVDAGWVAAFFEHGAGRGEDPGPPPGATTQS
jgi:predicted phosphodiesterase